MLMARTRWRRWVTFSIPAVLLAIVAATSITIERGRTVRVVDAHGAPVPGVLAVFHYEGSRLNFVHTSTYRAGPLSLARGDAGGRVEINRSVHVHPPFPLEGSTRLVVDLLYAPSLRNGWATILQSAVARDEIWSVAEDLETVTLHDLSDRPELWEGTLRNVSSVAHQLLAAKTSTTIQGGDLLNEWLAGFSQDYTAFLARHGEALRPRPQMNAALSATTSDADRRSWEEMTDRSLQQEPRWGDLVRRLFASDVEQFARAMN
jgi:hypothetical protein